MPEALPAPWTLAQVESLNEFQESGARRPFTCPHDGDELVAIEDGFKCPKCTFRQRWAWDWMADWSWRR